MNADRASFATCASGEDKPNIRNGRDANQEEKLTTGDFAQMFTAKSHSLSLPREDEEKINLYVAKQAGAQKDFEQRPFPRQVDFWSFSIAAALAWQLAPREGSVSQWGKNFVYSSQGIMDDDLCSLLTVVAVAKLGHDGSNVGDPGRIVDLGNRLAGAACPKVLRELLKTDLRTTPLDRALDLARSLQNSVRDI